MNLIVRVPILHLKRGSKDEWSMEFLLNILLASVLRGSDPQTNPDQCSGKFMLRMDPELHQTLNAYVTEKLRKS
jgi:predicted HicB family RNase H-like nuclease